MKNIGMAKKKDPSDVSFLKEKLDSVKEVLVLARGIISEFKDSKVESKHNVRFITPQIKVEYSEFQGDKEKSVIELLNKYEMWAHEICTSIIANQGSLKNSALREHLVESLAICESLDFSFRAIFKN